MNKSYMIGYRFQRRVLNDLKKKGYTCFTRPKSAFPDIIAYKPIFLDNEEMFFEIVNVECKVNKYLSKDEKIKAKAIIDNKEANKFLVAFRNKKRKIEYQELENVPQ